MASSRTEAFVVAGAVAAGARLLRRDIRAQLTGSVARFALRRGLRHGSRPWLYVAAGATTLQVLQRITSPKPEVMRMKLRPGQSLEIAHRTRTRG
jgi:hypothetical protein